MRTSIASFGNCRPSSSWGRAHHEIYLEIALCLSYGQMVMLVSQSFEAELQKHRLEATAIMLNPFFTVDELCGSDL